jgi:AcrR family transcriptional regulator
MNQPLRKRTRDPLATRHAILDASSSLFAQQGADSVSVSAVANLARVNRGTAYQHFPSREELIEATIEWVSLRMFRAVYGDPETIGERRVEEVDVPATMHRLSVFAMENAELCRSWLLQILASENPAADPFWKEFQGSLERFAQTKLAQENVDSEAMSVLVLSGAFLWPVWVRSHAKTDEERRLLANRMTRELLRLCLFGSMNPAAFPDLVERLRQPRRQSESIEMAGPDQT